MTLYSTHTPALGLFILALFVAGCSLWGGGDEGCDEDRYERRLQALRADIEAEIGDASAADVAACRTLPLGQKPCGGPWTYLVYSDETSDSVRLKSLAEDYDRIDAERNLECGLASDCALTPEPAVALENGRCVADGEG